ncbi:hypothetical protein [Nonomuraea wenchangensis]|uniref:Uncharacterized protein n=1 Tax=Nonomuraea wenchangensis TaxID=568860 RepID=A0A1I0EF22_9ACTN|nr:hypothetical protein [Nonomuraea wenchangensis]SET43135.1 hypothetical protein SAMN05421811_1032 [Nonomuraea wenchangensis]
MRESAGQRAKSSKRPDRYDDENHGPIETAVRREIAEIGLEGKMTDSYAEICYNLARTLDNGAGYVAAAVAKELRETLQMIEEASGDDNSADLFTRLAAHMPSPVRNAS